MAGDLQANIVIRAIDRATSTLRRVTKNFATMRAAQERADKSFQRAANFRQAAAGVDRFAKAARGAVAKPIEEFENFEQAMSRVRALGKSTPAELEAVRKQALLLGRTTEYTATAAARAAGNLSMMGFSKPKILEVMPSMLDLATASEMDLSQAATIAAGTLRSFQLEATSTNMQRVTDVLTTGFTSSAVSLGTLGESMKYAAPIASQFHMSIEEITPLVGMLGNINIAGSEAGTALRAMLMRIAAPVRMSGKAMKALGVNAYETVDGVKRMRPVLETLADIREKAMARPEDERNLIFMKLFGQVAMGPALALLNRFSSEEMRDLQASMTKSGGATQKTATIMRENGKTATEILKSAFSGLNIAIGAKLEPAFNRLKGILTDVFDRLTTLADAHPTLTRVIFGTIGVAALLATGLTALIFTFAAAATAAGVFSLALGGQRTGVQLLGAALKPLGSALRKAIPSITLWGASWWPAAAGVNATLWPVLAIIAAIAATVAVVYLAIKYWDRLVAIWERFRLVSLKTKAVILALLTPFQVLLAPITALITLVKIITADWEGLKTALAAPFVFALDKIKSVVEWLDKIKLPAPIQKLVDLHAKAGAGVAGFFGEIGEEMRYIATGAPAEAGAVNYQTSEFLRRTNDVSVGGRLKIEVDSQGQARVRQVEAEGINLDVGYVMGGAL